jgi:maltose O-acetyltransferase
MTMRERINSGKLFTDMCEGMPAERDECKRRMAEFNATTPDTMDRRMALMKETFHLEGDCWIEPPIYFCYGTHITFGAGCYVNCNCSFVDDGKVIIGKNVLFGPTVSVATVGHPLDPEIRRKGYMYAAPVVIGDDCWIGAGAVICPGVTIGKGCVIGAGSIVVKDIPDYSIAVGNPCHVLRKVDERDKKYYFRGQEITAEDLAEEAELAKNP